MLSGRTADGTGDLNLQIPFTKQPESRANAAIVLATICNQLGPDLKPDDLTPLTAKLLAHLSKTGAKPAEILNFPITALTVAIREDPDILTSRASIAAILRKQEQRYNRRFAENRRAIPDTVPDRIILWQHGRYRLEEATDPRHLQQEGAHMKHCLGTSHNIEALKHHGLPTQDRDAIHFLHYWMKIKSGDTRILSLTENGYTLYTMEWDTPTQTIQQVQGAHNRSPQPSDPAIPSLCRSIRFLMDNCGLKAVNGLYYPNQPDWLLTGDGYVIPATIRNLPHAVLGNVNVREGNGDLIQAAAQTALVTIDITHANPSELARLTRVRHFMFSTSNGPHHLPNCQSGRLYAPLASSAHLPSLTTGFVSAHYAEAADLTSHQSGCINLPSLRALHLPHHHSGTIYAPQAAL